MTRNEQDLVIVRSTIDLAHNLGMNVVAEGLESEEHLSLLRELGCNVGQGFFISEPRSIEALTSWFDRAPWHVGHPARNDVLAEIAAAIAATRPSPLTEVARSVARRCRRSITAATRSSPNRRPALTRAGPLPIVARALWLAAAGPGEGRWTSRQRRR